ncbi:MAG TPA: DUF72 domain-containing protein, partial [Burkholderiales bacterium]|nr:DUF72 domain-containing protein [Burkholderiales bacterium]
MGDIRIGISGWRYAPWRGVFYPDDLAQHRELEYASRALPSIEINGSFYSLQRPTSWASWYRDTPRGFVFSVKGPRYITHIRRLRSMTRWVRPFMRGSRCCASACASAVVRGRSSKKRRIFS